MNCPSCAAALPLDARLCAACGEKVGIEQLRREALLLQKQASALSEELRNIHDSRLWRLASLYWGLRRRAKQLLARGAPEPPPATPARTALEADPGRPAATAIQRVAERFAAFRRPGNQRFFEALARHLAPLENDPCLPMYFEFAITANERGEKVADLLERRIPLVGKTCLDIGCAYAGFLVAFARRGADVVGIDIDPQLLDLAEKNLEDAGIHPRLERRDATRAEDLAEFRNGFDVVTANDVIEHVADPASLLANIAGVLRPGGLAYFEIPNRHAVPFVREDGHYRLFGITLLDRPEAERYYALHAPGVAYGVGHYLELPEYQKLFVGTGLRFEVMDEDGGERAVRRIEDDVEQLRSGFDDRLRTVPEPVRELVRQRVTDYLDELERAPRRTAEERARFVERYGAAFWRILGTKP